MVIFKSIVVLDTETTGVPVLEHNATRIIEAAFYGCETDHIKGSKELPRVLHKLVLCFRPGKLIMPGATETSGLSNELLDNLSSFRKEDVDMINCFISRLPPPVCLIAHNGFKFDFPILRKTIIKLNCSLPNNVYCADSLIAFRELYPRPLNISNHIGEFTSVKDIESTPMSKKTIPENSLNYKRSLSYGNPGPISTDVSRNLFPDELDTFTPQNRNSLSHPNRYRMKDIYYFLHGENFPNAHRAEDDTKALLSCILKTDRFLDWINEHAIVFNSIEPLL